MWKIRLTTADAVRPDDVYSIADSQGAYLLAFGGSTSGWLEYSWKARSEKEACQLMYHLANSLRKVYEVKDFELEAERS